MSEQEQAGSLAIAQALGRLVAIPLENVKLRQACGVWSDLITSFEPIHGLVAVRRQHGVTGWFRGWFHYILTGWMRSFAFGTTYLPIASVLGRVFGTYGSSIVTAIAHMVANVCTYPAQLLHMNTIPEVGVAPRALVKLLPWKFHQHQLALLAGYTFSGSLIADITFRLLNKVNMALGDIVDPISISAFGAGIASLLAMPFDVVRAKHFVAAVETIALEPEESGAKPLETTSALQIAQDLWRQGGATPFFAGGVAALCSTWFGSWLRFRSFMHFKPKAYIIADKWLQFTLWFRDQYWLGKVNNRW